MSSTGEVSHGDILYQIGEMKGQLTTLIIIIEQKREDLNGAFARIGALEKTAVERPHLASVETRINILERVYARGVGIAIACSLILPFVVSAAKPLLHFGDLPQPGVQRLKP